MGVLFLISIAALLALLWAAFSIAQHVRRARRRQRSAIQAVAAAKLEVTHGSAVQNAGGKLAMQSSQVEPAVEEVVPDPSPTTRDWSQMRYPASGIIGSTFTGRSPKI